MRTTILILFLTSATLAFGGNPDYEWTITDACVQQSTTATLTFKLEINGDGIAGWQMAACHDAEVLTLDEVRTLDLGEPAFEGIVEQAEDGYWYVGMLVSFGDPDATLDEGGDAYEADYVVGLEGPGETTVDVCEEGLDGDGLSVLVGVDSLEAVGGSGTIKATSPLSYTLETTCGGYDDDTGVGLATVVVVIDDVRGDDAVGINGFSIALSSDPDEIVPLDGREGADLDEAAFFSVSVTDETATAAVIYDLTDLDVTQAFGEPSEVLEIDYETNPDNAAFDGTSDPVLTEITFEDTDIVKNQLGSVVEGVVITVDPLLNDGTLEWSTSCGGEFLRGDCDGNGVVFPILDAIYVLEYGFTDGPEPPCFAAADCDGNGTVFPVLEALYILEYGFTNGPAPADPGPSDCGPDTNIPGPGCETPPDTCS